jgi:hypothetical protein
MTHPAPPAPTSTDESRRRIRQALLDARRVAVGTHAGEEVRVRMMHPGAWLPDDESGRPLVYLASMKTDPKVREMSTRPEVALLLHESPTGEEASSWEMEVTGRAEVVRDAAERERAKQATMRTSSIVQYLDATGQTDLLAFVRVTPRFMKHRVFGEIVAGRPPSILEFADAAARARRPRAPRRRLGVWKETVRWPTLTASAASVVVGVAAAFFATGHRALGVGARHARRGGRAAGVHEHQERPRRPALGRRRPQPHAGARLHGRLARAAARARHARELLAAMLGFGLVSAARGSTSPRRAAGRAPLRARRAGGRLRLHGAAGAARQPRARRARRSPSPSASASCAAPRTCRPATSVRRARRVGAGERARRAHPLHQRLPGRASDGEVSKRTGRRAPRRAAREPHVPAHRRRGGRRPRGVRGGGALPPYALLGLAGFPLFVRAAAVARRHFDAPMELVPANAYTVVGHLASAVALAVGLVWAGLGGGANAAVLSVAGLGLVVVLYYNRSIGRLARAFYGVRDAVARS